MATIVGGYWSPLVEGLTPFTRTRVSAVIDRPDWPPYRDAERLARYADYTALIENRVTDVFDDLMVKSDQLSKIVIAANLPELLCNVWADAVWSDPPTIELPSARGQDTWDAIDTANDWSETAAWESLFGAAFSGTSVVRLYRSEEMAQTTGNVVQVEEIDPGIYFPILRRGSARLVESVVLAWEEDRSDPDAARADLWQVRELHELLDGRYTITRQERKAGESRDTFRTVAQPVIAEGVDFLPFVDFHAKRWRGRYWGVSELHRNLSIFDEVDNTLSNIGEILEYHGKPMLQVPASSIFGGTLTKGADKTLGIRDPAQAAIARYITYDGQISAQVEHIDKLLELAFLTAECPRTYFGLGLEGGAPSGTSLKLQLQNFVKKAARWQRNETKRSRAIVEMALRLSGFARGDTSITPEVTHGSPLPIDDEQEARIETSLFTAKLASQRHAMLRLRRSGGPKEVDEEIAEIEADRDASIAALPAPMRQPALQPGAPAPGNPAADATGTTTA